MALQGTAHPSGGGRNNNGGGGGGPTGGRPNVGGGGKKKKGKFIRVDPFKPEGIPETQDSLRFYADLQRQADVARSNRGEQQQQLYNEYFDPNNPYSRQALAARTLDQARRGDFNSAASSGNLYSGAQIAVGRDREFNGGLAQHQLSQGYLRDYSENERSYTDTLNELLMRGEDRRASDATARALDIESTLAGTGRVRRRRRRRKNRG
jgi:hypothetical protein